MTSAAVPVGEDGGGVGLVGTIERAGDPRI
jgi:hypothetical protein